MLEQLLYSTTPHNLNTSHLRTIIAALCIIREELIKGDLLFVF